MNVMQEEICELCGGDSLKSLTIKKGFIWMDDLLFCIRNYPGLTCSDCKEDYIRETTFDLFRTILKEGLYDSANESEIPVYLFGEIGHEHSQTLHRFDNNGNIYCVENVPVVKEGAFTHLESSTQKELQSLNTKIDSGQIKPSKHVKLITLYAQKN
jgi:hypothetical protein